jgi:hypothetical protein
MEGTVTKRVVEEFKEVIKTMNLTFTQTSRRHDKEALNGPSPLAM